MWTELGTAIRVLREQRRYARFTREELEADKLVRFRQLVAHANRNSPYRVLHTSGTSGEVGYFLYSRRIPARANSA
jgi:hypothetical protein